MKRLSRRISRPGTRGGAKRHVRDLRARMAGPYHFRRAALAAFVDS
jgi:hypothetical protein